MNINIKNILFRYTITLPLLVFFILNGNAQDKPIAIPDLSYAKMQMLEDTTKSQLQPVDSLEKTVKKKTKITDPISYNADSIQFSVSKKTTYLSGNAKIKYGKTTLTAEKIAIDWNNSELRAEAVQDTVDSLGFPVYKGIPHFEEKGTEPMEGLRLTYNFDTKRGRIWEGTTEMDPGYYRGVNIKKIGDKTMLIKDGYFTSCDHKNDPHFFFHSKKMWMRVGKKMVAKPIVLYIADIPIFYFPLAYMSLQKSRRSGIILPKYGQSTHGRYLKDFGYYWAMNDYMDMTLRSTYYDKGLWVYSGNYRYLKRYLLGGSVSGDYSPKDINTMQKRQRYKIRFNHKHDIKSIDVSGLRWIAPLSINASGKFQSDKTFNTDSYTDINERLDQDLSTTISLRKKFTGINSSLNISFYRNENLQSGNITRNFPQASFRLPAGQIGGKGKHWYGNISYNYNTKLTENYTKRFDADTTTFTETSKKGWNHDFSIRSSQKILKYFSISPNISLQELWVNQYRDYYWVDSLNTTDYNKRSGFKARHTFSTGISAKTTLYGLFEIPFSPLKLIRHKIDPSVSFSYKPDFSEEHYGYVQHFTDSTGKTIKGDIFGDNPYGGTSTSKSQSLNFRVNNLFQGKIIKDGEEKKIDLFSWNLSSNYNMLADSLKWNDIRSSVNASIKGFKLTGSLTHSLYETKMNGTGRRDEFYYQNHSMPLRFVNARFNTGININSKMFSKKEKKGKDDSEEQVEEKDEGVSEFSGSASQDDSFNRREKSLDQLRKSNTSWQANFGLSYSYDKTKTYGPQKQFGINSNFTLQLTKNWKIRYDANIDAMEKEIRYQTITVLRDLHCWEMHFRWQPPRANSSYSFFEFRINVKSSALKDLKLTKSGTGSTTF